jgi:hypothetical protein
MTLDAVDQRMIADAAAAARAAGVSEAKIEAVIAEQLELGEDTFGAIAAAGRLGYYARQRRPPRPPSQSPTVAPVRAPHEW